MEIDRLSFCDYRFYQFWSKNIENIKMGEAELVDLFFSSI